jgi:hypothetical protein
MRWITFVLTAVLLCAWTAAPAADSAERLSLKAQFGESFNLADGPESELFSDAGMISADIHYRLTKHVSLVPASVAVYWFSPSVGSDELVGGSYSYGRPLFSTRIYRDPWYTPYDYIYDNYYYYGGYGYGGYGVRGNSGWAVSFTPGVKLHTDRWKMVELYGQFGAGVYRHDQTALMDGSRGQFDHTGTAVKAEAGLEVNVVEKVGLLLGAGYMWIDGVPAVDGLASFHMGVLFGF